MALLLGQHLEGTDVWDNILSARGRQCETSIQYVYSSTTGLQKTFVFVPLPF